MSTIDDMLKRIDAKVEQRYEALEQAYKPLIEIHNDVRLRGLVPEGGITWITLITLSRLYHEELHYGRKGFYAVIKRYDTNDNYYFKSHYFDVKDSFLVVNVDKKERALLELFPDVTPEAIVKTIEANICQKIEKMSILKKATRIGSR